MAIFKINPDWEKQLGRAAERAVKSMASDYQTMLDTLAKRYKGRPVSEIKPALQREWKKIGGSITDPELTQYASHISEGIRIQMKTK
ncbi:hypothetical protein DQ226_11625 [Dietzia maris]|uniref:Uncharacterized protein n=1 Tax=Dietzia maris TaxID=37915 RepID=A0A365P9I5_9ACTN|nr:hypothetical protein [Dietzia sp. KRD202]RBA33800.1 hypothetical protein DQ226_11625 [Dietzia maris]